MCEINSDYFNNSYTDGFFNVSAKHGFLPIKDPLASLPDTYLELQNLIDNLYVYQPNNTNGVLAIPNEIVKCIDSIPNYSNQIELESDVFVLQALYRALTFVTSGYTLELSYQEFKKSDPQKYIKLYQNDLKRYLYY